MDLEALGIDTTGPTDFQRPSRRAVENIPNKRETRRYGVFQKIRRHPRSICADAPWNRRDRPRTSQARSLDAFTRFRIRDLHGNARHISVGTEHATVALVRTQQHTAAFAVVVELAGIRWHFQVFSETACGASES